MICIVFSLISLSHLIRVERSDQSLVSIEGDCLKISEFGEYNIIPQESFWGQVKLWGAGGGSNGGKGGYSSGDIYFIRNVKYILHVGQGGIETEGGAPESFGGGGSVGITNSAGVYVGTGGGYSALFNDVVSQSNCVILAGGGGGGMIYNPWGEIRGGNGGGIAGEQGYYKTYPSYSGGGGTQTAGGSRGAGGWNLGSLPGSSLKGGRGATSQSSGSSGSGGGGGYFGGGGGTNGNYAGGPGGGGSGFIDSSLVINGSTSFFVDDVQRISNCGEKSKNGLFVLNLVSGAKSPMHRNFVLGYPVFLQGLILGFTV